MRTTYPLLKAWKLPRDKCPTYIALPREVPYKMVCDHEAQAMKNHYQTLTRLAERGGLAPCEMLAVIEDRPWKMIPDEEAAIQILAYIKKYE